MLSPSVTFPPGSSLHRRQVKRAEPERRGKRLWAADSVRHFLPGMLHCPKNIRTQAMDDQDW